MNNFRTVENEKIYDDILLYENNAISDISKLDVIFFNKETPRFRNLSVATAEKCNVTFSADLSNAIKLITIIPTDLPDFLQEYYGSGATNLAEIYHHISGLYPFPPDKNAKFNLLDTPFMAKKLVTSAELPEEDHASLVTKKKQMCYFVEMIEETIFSHVDEPQVTCAIFTCEDLKLNMDSMVKAQQQLAKNIKLEIIPAA